MLNINAFHFKQMFNDSKGKTSMSYVLSFLIVVTGLNGIIIAGTTIVGMVIWNKENTEAISFMNMLVLQCVGLVTTGVALIMTNRLTKDKEISPSVDLTKNNEELSKI